jgi:CBS domain-containing protein
MGDLAVKIVQSPEDRQRYLRQLLQEVRVLDAMVRENRFEKGRRRIGAEQELCLIDENGEPSMAGPEILAEISDPHYTSELGRFNLEINLDPFTLRSDCLRRSERQLIATLGLGNDVATDHGAHILLTGILPTLTQRHLTWDNMTPLARYHHIAREVREQRGADFEIYIQGVDELLASLDSMMFEACNTSFQLHLQIHPPQFVRAYNWAQFISGPVLAAAVNSPILFGRELWQETRIALFQQSVDTRRSTNCHHERQARVFFGRGWLRDSIVDLFKDHVTRFPIFLTKEIGEDAEEVWRAGGAPELRALRLHNGTIYNWNRPCYGVIDGHAHLRIENRYIPAGPTLADEMANFAFWLGVMEGQPEEYANLPSKAHFSDAKENFYRAARNGLHSLFNWFGKEISVTHLILNELLMLAQNGLTRIGLNHSDIDRYLGIIEARVASGRNGAQWQINNFRRLTDTYNAGIATGELTRGMLERQNTGMPVHTWPDIDTRRIFAVDHGRDTLGQLMRTDLYTVAAGESMAFVKAIMEWKNIRHLPVEDAEGKLVGLVTATNLNALNNLPFKWEDLPVKEIMVKELVTAAPETPVNIGAQLMRSYSVGCLLIAEDGKLLGLMTDTDMRNLGLMS